MIAFINQEAQEKAEEIAAKVSVDKKGSFLDLFLYLGRGGVQHRKRTSRAAGKAQNHGHLRKERQANRTPKENVSDLPQRGLTVAFHDLPPLANARIS